MTNGPRLATIDGRSRTKRAILTRLARELDFPAHFRPNLDALFDTLRTDVKGPFTIRWTAAAEARAHLGADYDAIVGVLRDVVAVRPDVTVTIEE